MSNESSGPKNGVIIVSPSNVESLREYIEWPKQDKQSIQKLQLELGKNQPTICKFIDGLRKVQKGIEPLVAGHRTSLKLKKYNREF